MGRCGKAGDAVTYLLAYTAAGHEFETAEAINAMGALAVVPRKVEAIRLPKRRYAEAVISPVLPNYLFLAMSPEQWHQAQADRIIFATVKWIGPNEWRRVQAYAERVEQDYMLRMEQIEARERVSEYDPGQALQLLGGAFRDSLAVFRRIVEGGKFPMVEYEVKGVRLLGKPIIGEIDPVLVRKAEII